MRWKLRSALAFAACAAASLSGSEPPLELSGVMTDGEKARFALTDKTTGQTTWVESGAEHAGYKIGGYNSKEETVTLEKGLERFPLRLVVAKSVDPTGTPIANAETVVPPDDPGVLAIRNNLRQLALAARQHQLETGSALATYADLVGPDKPVKQLTPVDGEDYTGLIFGPSATNLSVTTAKGITVAIDTAPALSTLGHVAAASAPAAPTDSAAATSNAVPVAPASPESATPLTPTGPVTATHVVREGDTLPVIAEAAGVPLEQLRALNPEVNPGSLKVGQPIRIR